MKVTRLAAHQRSQAGFSSALCWACQVAQMRSSASNSLSFSARAGGAGSKVASVLPASAIMRWPVKVCRAMLARWATRGASSSSTAMRCSMEVLVATAVSTPLKRAFNDFNSAPFVVRGLFAEVSDDPTKDEYYAIDYDGEYTVSNGWGVVAGTLGVSESIGTRLGKEAKNLATDQAVATLRELYISETRKEGVSDEDRWRGLNDEAVLLERARAREDRFRILTIA